LPLYFVSRVKQMISEGTESNLPPKSCTWIARWSLEIKGSSSKLRLDHRMALGDRG